MTGALDGETAVVTGASSGIGEATARELAREGATVVLAARREERLEAIADDLRDAFGVEVRAVPTDVREQADVAALVETTVEEFGGLDVLVNNAGLARGSDVEEMSTEEYRTMMATSVEASSSRPARHCRTCASATATSCSSGASPASTHGRSTRWAPPPSGGCVGSRSASRRAPAPTASP